MFNSKPSSRASFGRTLFTYSRSNTQPEEDLYEGSIKNYSLGCTLGQGAYAVVKEAVFLPLGDRYAVKIYEKLSLLDPNKKRNVVREIKILRRLRHKHIVYLKEAIDDLRHIHLVMEKVDGISLHTYIKQFPRRQIPEEETRRIFQQLVSAVAYCHSKHIAHRDLKLDNILLDRHNEVKLVDFGFSTYIPSNKPVKLYCGTPSYMAPEIVLKKEFRGPPADIWALGVLLYVMINGFFPFKGTNNRELTRKIIKGHTEIPTRTPEIVRQMLHMDPEKRPTAEQVAASSWVNGKREPTKPDNSRMFFKRSSEDRRRRSLNKENFLKLSIL